MKLDISHVVKLANLTLTRDEEEKFKKQLEDTLRYIENLNELDTNNVEPISQVTGLENATREDKVKTSLSQKDALKNAKSTYKGFFKVKGILNSE